MTEYSLAGVQFDRLSVNAKISTENYIEIRNSSFTEQRERKKSVEVEGKKNNGRGVSKIRTVYSRVSAKKFSRCYSAQKRANCAARTKNNFN